MAGNSYITNKHVVQDHELRKIVELLESIEYGTLTVVVQDGKILQIEKNEKFRLK